MQSVLRELDRRTAQAVATACRLDPTTVDPQVRRAQDPRFGDYQSNCAMSLAKTVGTNPRELAGRIIETLDVTDICEPPEVAGPGFINLTLKPAFVASRLAAVPPAPTGELDRMGIPVSDQRIVVAVDMSSPNLAKEMHVGHLRSTVIGDCIARILEFDGHEVHRINHVGDWGTQFGMLLAYLRRTRPHVLDQPDKLYLDNLEQFYVQAKSLYDADPDFAAESRRTVVELQRGQPDVVAVWEAFCSESLRHCREIYNRLDVELENRGESFYNNMLPNVVREFHEKGLAVESQGAICIFLEGFTARDGEPLPMIIQKSDGGYNYDTTDLAAVKHRTEQLGAERLIYVVGIAQKQHFDMLFAAAREIGWATDNVRLEHIGFGNMLGPDGKPFKTRTGGTVKLRDLLDEAVARARSIVESDSQEGAARSTFDADTIEAIAHAVGVGAIKYFDLSHSLSGDYKFDFDTMLAMDGNTAPYMLYAYARIRSIGRKAGVTFEQLPPDTPVILEHESEIRLAKTLIRFAETIDVAGAELRPNVLTDYLFELSRAFSYFYDRRHGVRVIDAETPPLRASRLRLCDLTARTLKLGLGLLGIKTVEQM
jgi:arginyl-tRNA synthetase